MKKVILLFTLLAVSLSSVAQRHNFDRIEKRLEDVLLFENLSDIAYISKVRIESEPRTVQTPNGNAFHDSLLDNGLVFYSYVFIPKTTKQSKKYPLIVFPHGGIHGTMTNVYVPFLRELMAQGYIIIAPDYRGSTGYGKGFYEAIDYGGRETEDVLAATKYMVENYDIVDAQRVGVAGWSHGGMLALMNVLQYPDMYACAFAGVPVSDVAYRLEYMGESYEKEFTASYHIGKSPSEAPEEYARRSPSSYAKNLRKPLMINTAKNDDDVSWTEVKRMIDSLQYYKKDFEYKIYEAMPGAHVFERIDVSTATEVRFQTHMFLNKYLLPPKPFKNIKQMRKAGYYYH